MDCLRLPPALRTTLVAHLRPSLLRQLSTASALQPNGALQPNATPPPQTEPLLTLSSTTLNDYTTSHPPTSHQLKHASHFFHHVPPHLLYSAAHFRSFPPSPHPEIAFLGRSNVGKSSLLNALFGRPNEAPAYVSKKPGKTRTMNGFGIGGEGMGKSPAEGEKDGAWKRFGRGGVVVVDMPGYGGGSREEWGKEAMKYLSQRKQLRKTFVLLDAVHGPKKTDVELLKHFRANGVPFSIVLSKADKLLYPGAKLPGARKLSNGLEMLGNTRNNIREELRRAFNDGREVRDDILCCSAEKSLDEKSGYRARLGIDELRFAVLSSCGLESDEMGAPRGRISMSDIVRDHAV